MPDPQLVQKAQQKLQDPNLAPDVRAKLEAYVGAASAPQAAPQAPQAPQAAPQAPQAAPQAPMGPPQPPRPAPQTPEPGPLPQPPSTLGGTQPGPTLEAAAAGTAGWQPIDYDVARHRLTLAFDETQTDDVKLADDLSNLDEKKKQLQQYANREGIDTSLRSLSQEPQFTRPPVTPTVRAADEAGEIVKPWMHVEPRLDDMIELYEQLIGQYGGEDVVGVKPGEYRAALRDLREHGTDSKTYKRFADAQWMEVYDIARSQGLKAIRMKFADASNDGDPDEQVAARMQQGGPVMYNTLDAATFGLGVPFLGWWNNDMEDHPLAAPLRERGLYTNETDEYRKMQTAGGGAQELLGNAMGLLTGGAGQLYRAIAKRGAANKARGALARAALTSAATGSVDAAAGTIRRIAEMAATGRDISMEDVSDAAVSGLAEGVVNAGFDLGGSLAGEAISGMRGNARAYDELKRAAEEGGLRHPKDTGHRWFGPPAIEDDLIYKSIQDAKVVPERGAPESAPGLTDAAARRTAQEVRPRLNEQTRKIADAVHSRTATFFADPAVRNPMPQTVDATHGALRDLVRQTSTASDDVRHEAAKALANISDMQVVNDVGAQRWRSEGYLVLDLDSDADVRLIREMGWQPNVTRERLKRAKRGKQSANMILPPAGGFEASGFGNQRIPEGPLGLVPDDEQVLWESARDAMDREAIAESTDAATGRPPGRAAPKKRQALTVDSLDPSRFATDAAGGYRDYRRASGPREPLFVVVKPKAMDAEGFYKTLQNFDTRAKWEAKQGRATESTRRAAAAMREDAERWKDSRGRSLNYLRDRNRRDIYQLESVGKVLGMSERAMSGAEDVAAFATDVESMSLRDISRAIRSMQGEGKTAAERETLYRFFDSPRLTRYLKAARAVMAHEYATRGTGGFHLSQTANKPTPHGVFNMRGVKDILYNRTWRLERAHKQGQVPRAMRILMSDDAKAFLRDVSEEKLKMLLDMLDEFGDELGEQEERRK